MSEASALVVGIDVAKDTLEVATSAGEHWQVDNDPQGQEALRDRLAGLGAGLIVLEATGGFEITAAAASAMGDVEAAATALLAIETQVRR